jgi:hypothetical protein
MSETKIEAQEQFRRVHNNATAGLDGIAEELIETEDHLRVIVEHLGNMALAVEDEFDSIDGNAEWPSDAYVYFNENLGRVSTLVDLVGFVRAQTTDLAAGLRRHKDRYEEARKP